MVRAQGEEPEGIVVGDEDVNESAAAYLDSILREDETPVAVSAFDDETRVLAITNRRILVADEQPDGDDDGWRLVLDVYHDDVSLLTRDGRTLVIETKAAGERRYRFGQDQTVEELIGMARSQQTDQARHEERKDSAIADRVRFWEEQDKINQELIPRVLRLNELLAKHVAEHDSLPEVAGNVLSQALAVAREERRQQYEAAWTPPRKSLPKCGRSSNSSTTQLWALPRKRSRSRPRPHWTRPLQPWNSKAGRCVTCSSA